MIIGKSSHRYEFEFQEFGAYSALALQVKLKRNTSFYYYTISLPSTAAMILILTIFWLPSHSSIRFTLGSISLFIGMSLLLFLGIQLGSSSYNPPLAGKRLIKRVLIYCCHTIKSYCFLVRNVSTLVIMAGISLVISTLSHQLLFISINSNFSLPIFVTNLLRGIAGQLLCIGESCIQLNTRKNMDRVLLASEEGNPQNEASNSNVVNTRQQDWIIFFAFLDRIYFVVYFLILVIKHA